MKFAKVLGIRSVPVNGGSQTNKQINALKNGAEIVICTPGRMIDFLCKNNGRMINLHKVTYLVLDEADRMFDMGFEPQITHIVQSTRPGRQIMLFSATFPRTVEQLTLQILTKPVEIQVGGRNVVNKDIIQLVEVIPESEWFLRLLELLGKWYEKDFRNDVSKILIATSVAARGLDVKELELVINFHVPNQYEDYIHRVGRTGRAGRKES
ncbi:DEAD-box ATP-dependent RNA helicase 45-like [Papaver somniferum]|uniref:DEAD-box ATP-dependent RNA helicase 45-like n=1 Tax=Papaver somniferum TaxID=3469 RepID=UPI000E6FE313|nr:DEAD-box ATP-dependent RNA helicase 45-like [Papaver somniferum]